MILFSSYAYWYLVRVGLMCFGCDVCCCWVDCFNEWIVLNDDSDGVMIRLSTQSKHKQVFLVCSKDVKQIRLLPLSSHKPIIDCLFDDDSVVIAGKAISLD